MFTKTVLITGSTSGIGRETALEFYKNGFNVIVNGRNEIRGQEVAKEVKGEFIKADVTDPEAVRSMFSRIKHLDVLINNAGGVVGQDSFLKAGKKDLEESFKTNFFSAVYCSQFASKIIKRGSIVNVASVCGLQINPKGQSEFIPYYSAAKAAMINFSTNLARILAPNIRVNCVVPGYTKTKSWNLYMTVLVKIKRLADETLVRRFITPQEVAQGIYTLATNEAITGSQLLIDGGAAAK